MNRNRYFTNDQIIGEVLNNNNILDQDISNFKPLFALNPYVPFKLLAKATNLNTQLYSVWVYIKIDDKLIYYNTFVSMNYMAKALQLKPHTISKYRDYNKALPNIMLLN